MVNFTNVTDVVRWRLCVGCGACFFACKNGNISLVDVIKDGIRPLVNNENCKRCGNCLAVCPGLGSPERSNHASIEIKNSVFQTCGPILEVWEGYAADPQVRLLGSSGGAATALALFALNAGFSKSIIHIGQDKENIIRNRTYNSCGKDELIQRTGSRYSPASPCEGLKESLNFGHSFVFIGKPCDIHGLRKAQYLFPELEKKLALAIGIFCAGTPATYGLLSLLEKMDVKLEETEEIRFRGNGWPGNFSLRRKGEEKPYQEISYLDSWGYLQKFRPFRCYLCPDGTSEFADISCGDPWHRKMKEEEEGYSLILVRTEKGRNVLHRAIEAGYLKLERAHPGIIIESQKNLIRKRREIWGRLFALKLLGIPTPKYDGFPLYENWKYLSVKDKARTIAGTFRRIIQRKYYLSEKFTN